MRAVLRCDCSEGGKEWEARRLGTRVAGLSLLERHLLGLRDAGITEVDIVGCDDVAEAERHVAQASVPGLVVRVTQGEEASREPGPFLIQRADTVVDPRVVARMTEEYRERGVRFECVAPAADPTSPDSTSPYTVGVPTRDDIHPVDPGVQTFAIGVSWAAGESVVPFQIGRHYWHRVWTATDARIAGRKVLLATMKPTDGIYARTNRRVSLRLSALLLTYTRVSPNAVTMLTLGWSALAGVLFAGGSYSLMVLGSLVSWFASMLDGVDGELARSKFQATRFGAWLEMVCDYLYYVFVFTGMGIGVYRRTGDPLWMVLGFGSAVGAVLAFAAVAVWKQRYFVRRGSGDAGYAFQQDVEGRAADPLLSFTRRTMVLATRAALPYYIVAFTVLNLVEVLLACTFVGTHAAWLLVVYASRSTPPSVEAAPRALLPPPDEAGVSRS